MLLPVAFPAAFPQSQGIAFSVCFATVLQLFLCSKNFFQIILQTYCASPFRLSRFNRPNSSKQLSPYSPNLFTDFE